MLKCLITMALLLLLIGCRNAEFLTICDLNRDPSTLAVYRKGGKIEGAKLYANGINAIISGVTYEETGKID